MGLFDYLTCAAPLPPEYADMQRRHFQTKSLECDGWSEYHISADGRLILKAKERKRRDDPDSPFGFVLDVVREWDEPEDFTGEVWFCDFRDAHAPHGDLIDFRARFVDGVLFGPIVATENARHIVRDLVTVTRERDALLAVIEAARKLTNCVEPGPAEWETLGAALAALEAPDAP